MSNNYDIIVIGGGHAGAEAAWSASRLGARTALVTMQIEAIGRMSCNPAIGGIGKGQMVREIDALGGLMGLAADACGIHFRMLNKRKGPAVWSPRAQADRDLYPLKVQELLRACPNIEFVEGLVDDIVTVTTDRDARVSGVRLLDGRTLKSSAVIVTTGTFMRGLMHCGEQKTEGGRVGELSSEGLSGRLMNLGFRLGRLKTGTPPRVHRDSINYAVLEPQPGDQPPTPFSYMVRSITQPQIQCWIAYTNPRGHEIIKQNLHRARMYSGQIQATGVRYCPSIEDKVVRFADNPRHQVYLEPEGYDNEWVYCNGLGTSLPQDAQQAFVRSIAGLEKAKILQWGYAVEYDFVPTCQTRFSLETKRVRGLFLAGQINGTSGYEEAAGQGLLAGINAARQLHQEDPVILGRDQAYIGVMIDDLITRPPDEPYRMFTSRAEYRMMLRSDNADERLTPLGREIGLVDDARWQHFDEKSRCIAATESMLRQTNIDGKPLLDVLRRPDAKWQDVVDAHEDQSLSDVDPHVREQILIRAKYSGYLGRMHREVQRMQKMDSCRIPVGFCYDRISHLRFEAREKLTSVQPMTLGQASRISGLTPADITVLWLSIEAQRRAPTNPTANVP